MDKPTQPLDCACVIHGDAYSWDYVDRLYNMLSRNCSRPIRLHVYTEPERPVPAHMVKHELASWSVFKGWWYKLQMFNTDHFAGELLYFDLDVVIVNNIDWIWKLPTSYMWAIRDFKYLWKPSFTGINSSVMWWDTEKYSYVWDRFDLADVDRYRGDQDFISAIVETSDRFFFDTKEIQSWRWQAFDGGYDFAQKRHKTPGTGTCIDNTSVLVFHGSPKPHGVDDVVIKQHWI